MFLNLLKKEFKYLFKNITFCILIIIIGFFYFSEFSPSGVLKKCSKPKTPEEYKINGMRPYYGNKNITDRNKEIKQMYIQMCRDYEEGSFTKVRVILNVQEKLNLKEKEYLKKAMEEIAPKEFLDSEDSNLIKVSYDEYLKIVRDLDKKLGGNTYYGDKMRSYLLSEEKTYKEAVNDFQDIIYKDKITNAGARYFSDYMGITAGLFPVFLAAFILIKDRRSRMEELICSRSVSGGVYIISKYAALCLGILLIYILYASHATFVFKSFAKANNYSIDIMAFYKYTLCWILPTILFTVALGMLLSVIFNNGIVAIFAQFILWILSIRTLGGDYGLSKFIIRFNTFGEHSQYIKFQNAICVNRIFYIVVSILLIVITSFIWSKKRGAVGEHIH